MSVSTYTTLHIRSFCFRCAFRKSGFTPLIAELESLKFLYAFHKFGLPHSCGMFGSIMFPVCVLQGWLTPLIAKPFGSSVFPMCISQVGFYPPGCEMYRKIMFPKCVSQGGLLPCGIF